MTTGRINQVTTGLFAFFFPSPPTLLFPSFAPQKKTGTREEPSFHPLPNPPCRGNGGRARPRQRPGRKRRRKREKRWEKKKTKERGSDPPTGAGSQAFLPFTATAVSFLQTLQPQPHLERTKAPSARSTHSELSPPGRPVDRQHQENLLLPSTRATAQQPLYL